MRWVETAGEAGCDPRVDAVLSVSLAAAVEVPETGPDRGQEEANGARYISQGMGDEGDQQNSVTTAYGGCRTGGICQEET